MVLRQLIGKEIQDILVKVEFESYGLDKADSFIILRDNLIIGIPFDIDEDVWERDLDKEAKSVFADKRNNALVSIKGKKIIDFLKFMNNEDKAILELEDEKFITEITTAPNGTGHAGLWVFQSRQELEKRYGTDYKRLNEDKGSAQQ